MLHEIIFGLFCLCPYCFIQPYLLPACIQAEQADKAADLQQEINKNSQASKQRECPHCRHVGQGSWRKQSQQYYQHVTQLQPFVERLDRLFSRWNAWLSTSIVLHCLKELWNLPRKKATVSEKEERNMLGATSPRIRPICWCSSSWAMRLSL